MPQAFVNYIASAMPSATVDKWDVAYNFIRDGKLTAGDFIGIGIQVTASRHHYLFCVTNRFVAQEDAGDEDNEDYVEVVLKIKKSDDSKASVVKTTKYAGLEARPVAIGVLSRPRLITISV